MSNKQTFSFYEKYISLKTAKKKLDETKTKYFKFIKEMYSQVESDESIEKLEEKTEKLSRKIEMGNLFTIDIICIFLFILVGIQWSFQKYAEEYSVISIILVVFFACLIFINIRRNKIKFCHQQIDLIKDTFNELANPNKYYERLGVDTFTITLGKDIAWIKNTDQNGNLQPRIVALRKQLVDELGYIIPNIRILYSPENEPNEFDIWVRGKLVAKEEINEKPDFLTEADVIAEELKKVSLQYVDYIFSLQNVYKLSEYIQEKDAALHDYVYEYIDNLDIRNILVGLIKNNRSIKDIDFIYQEIADYARKTTDTDEIIKKIKSDIDKLSKTAKDLI